MLGGDGPGWIVRVSKRQEPGLKSPGGTSTNNEQNIITHRRNHPPQLLKTTRHTETQQCKYTQRLTLRFTKILLFFLFVFWFLFWSFKIECCCEWFQVGSKTEETAKNRDRVNKRTKKSSNTAGIRLQEFVSILCKSTLQQRIPQADRAGRCFESLDFAARIFLQSQHEVCNLHAYSEGNTMEVALI